MVDYQGTNFVGIVKFRDFPLKQPPIFYSDYGYCLLIMNEEDRDFTEKSGLLLFEFIELMGRDLAYRFFRKLEESMTYTPPPEETLSFLKKSITYTPPPEDALGYYYPLSIKEKADFEGAVSRFIDNTKWLKKKE